MKALQGMYNGLCARLIVWRAEHASDTSLARVAENLAMNCGHAADPKRPQAVTFKANDLVVHSSYSRGSDESETVVSFQGQKVLSKVSSPSDDHTTVVADKKLEWRLALLQARSTARPR